MGINYDLLLPDLKEFSIEGCGFKVVDPSQLPGPTLKAFDRFIRGSATPHPVFVYSHDYARFCKFVREGKITINDKDD